MEHKFSYYHGASNKTSLSLLINIFTETTQLLKIGDMLKRDILYFAGMGKSNWLTKLSKSNPLLIIIQLFLFIVNFVVCTILVFVVIMFIVSTFICIIILFLCQLIIVYSCFPFTFFINHPLPLALPLTLFHVHSPVLDF